ncbi:putative protein arginine N-methyltransferase 3 [Apostasia shenzhenica]|uniref:type I protein arginine methyltransferase n=1 Tax=Apostasia shenzhenica TaxID=1088818 RepID=A0A2I0ASG0_9ASPA|nr:putative protein arginine N-methyltransferase 3 [Apostasia shenzhenica]
MATVEINTKQVRGGEEEDDDDDEEDEEAGEDAGIAEAWDDWQSDEEELSSDYLCLFCATRYNSSDLLFDHCVLEHSFDFRGIVRDLGLDFYGSLKLINFVRTQVAQNKCWSCGLSFQCNADLNHHLHAAANYGKEGKFLWDDDIYLKPLMIDDALLHSFVDDLDEDDCEPPVSKEEVFIELLNNEDMNEIYSNNPQAGVSNSMIADTTSGKDLTTHVGKSISNDIFEGLGAGELCQRRKDRKLKVSFANVAAREIKNVNEDYFGSYSSFGIHREMIGDKVRTEAYRCAILNNSSLFNGATIMDVGCGTGILSLFAAQAGASSVIAVEASTKMAAVATQIANDNGFLCKGKNIGKGKDCSGVVIVVPSMVEELDKFKEIPLHSVDVLVSEWMGYCLLYESMLGSVLYARDHWLKPSGAILPDTATIFVAGFGRGGTSLPFWENVYGFDMSCIGKEIMEDAARFPIVDVINSRDIVTESAVLQSFDLVTMSLEEMDFTSNCDLVLKDSLEEDSANAQSNTYWCYGIILWFETGFTNRFCKETPVVLSTSPYSSKTHWCQTIFTFHEPVAMASRKSFPGSAVAAVGTEQCPAVRVRTRISIARSSVHRSIDISLETMGISFDGRKRNWPAQIFDL